MKYKTKIPLRIQNNMFKNEQKMYLNLVSPAGFNIENFSGRLFKMLSCGLNQTNL